MTETRAQLAGGSEGRGSQSSTQKELRALFGLREVTGAKGVAMVWFMMGFVGFVMRRGQASHAGAHV
jgi:hypothetical protein